MRSARILILAAVALIVSYLADEWLASVRLEARRQFDTPTFVYAETGVRLVLVALLVVVGWVVLRGPRSRAIGAILVVVGLAVALTPILWFIGPPIPGFLVSTLSYGSGLLLWTGATIAALGLASLIRPTSEIEVG
jgi:hypothetical protein